MIKNICVYCSSSNAIEPVYFQSAKKVGSLIARHDCTLVYGAGMIGLMGAVAHSVHAHKGHVIGVIPEALDLLEVAYRDSDEFIVTQTMRQRKEIMEKKADAFIALPGGFGTLEEILEIITLKQLQYHTKPIVILNTNNFYSHLIAQFEKLFSENFAHKDNRELYFITDNEEEAFDYIFNYRGPTRVTPKI